MFVDSLTVKARLGSMKLRIRMSFIPYSQAHRERTGRTQDKDLFEVVDSHPSEQNTSYRERMCLEHHSDILLVLPKKIESF